MANITPKYTFYYLQQGDVLYPGFDYDNMVIAENQLQFAFEYFGPCVGSGWTVSKLSSLRDDQLTLLSNYISDPTSEFGQKLVKMDLGFPSTRIVSAGTTQNITLSGGAPNSVDGVSLDTNYKVLVKSQTDKKQNGIYNVDTLGTGSNGTWTRAGILNTSSDFNNNFTVYVSGGVANTSTLWIGSSLGNTFGNIDLYFHNAFDQCVKVWPGNGIVDTFYAKTEMPHYFRYRFNDNHYLWAEKTLNLPYNSICKISSPTPPEFNYGKDSNSAYLATVVTGSASTLYDLTVVDEIIYGPSRVKYSEANSDFQNKLKDKFLKHRHLGGTDNPEQINLATHISLFARAEYLENLAQFSPVLVLKNSDGTDFVGNFDNYGIPKVYIDGVLLDSTDYRFVLNSTPNKLILKNSVSLKSIVEIVLPLYSQKSLSIIDNNGNLLTSSITASSRKFLTDDTQEDRTPDDNTVNLVYKVFNWSSANYLDAKVYANGTLVDKKHYTVNPANGSISFASSLPNIGSLTYDDISITLDAIKAEIQNKLPSSKQKDINASSFSRGSIGSTQIDKLSHNYFSRYKEPATFTFTKNLISGFASSIFYPANTNSDLQFNTKLNKIYQSVNFDTNEIIYLTKYGLMSSSNSFKNINKISSWSNDYGVVIDFKDELVNSSGENYFTRSLALTEDGDIFLKRTSEDVWKNIPSPKNSLNSEIPITCFDISTDKVETADNIYEYSSYIYAGTDEGVYSAIVEDDTIEDVVNYYETGFYNNGSTVTITNINDLVEISSQNIQFVAGQVDTIIIDRNLYVVSDDNNYPGLYVGNDVLVNRKINGSFKGITWIDSGTENENLNDLIWWDDYDVYITHTANYYESENNVYWDHPFTIDAGSYTDCDVATTENITLSGTPIIDGYSTSSTNRVLVKNQNDPTENGIYVVSAGSWSRASDLNQNSEFIYGKTVSITNGTKQSGSIWFLKYSDAYTLGSTDFEWGIYKFKIYSTSTPPYTATRSIVKDVIVRKSDILSHQYLVVHTDGFALVTDGDIPTSQEMVYEAPYQGNLNSALSLTSSDVNGKLYAASDYGLYSSTDYFWTPKDQITNFSIDKSAWNRTENLFSINDSLKIVNSSGTAQTGFNQYFPWQMIEFDASKTIGLLLNYEREFKTFTIDPWKYDFQNDDGTDREYNLVAYVNDKPSTIPFTTNSETGEINFINSVGADNYENVSITLSANNPYFINNGTKSHDEIFSPAYKVSHIASLYSSNSATSSRLYLNQTIEADLKLLLLESGNNREIVYVEQIDNFKNPVEVEIYFSRDQYGSNFEFPISSKVYAIQDALTDNIQDDLYQLLSNENYNIGSLNNANVSQLVLSLQEKYSSLFDVLPAAPINQTDTRGLKNLKYSNDLINDALYDSTNSSLREYLGIPKPNNLNSYNIANVIDVANASTGGTNLVVATDNGVWIYKNSQWFNIQSSNNLNCTFVDLLEDGSYFVGTTDGLYNLSSSYALTKNNIYTQSTYDFIYGFFDGIKYRAFAKSDGVSFITNYDTSDFNSSYISQLDGLRVNKLNKISHTRVSDDLFTNYDVLYASSKDGIYGLCLASSTNIFSSDIVSRKLTADNPEGVNNYFGAFVPLQIPSIPVNNNQNNNLFILTNDGILKVDNYRWCDPNISDGSTFNISNRFLRGLECTCFAVNSSDSSNSEFPGKSKIFIGTNKGVFRSLDGGEYFETTNRFDKKFAAVNNLQYFSSTYQSGGNPVTKDVLLASTNLGLWYSVDDGDNWFKCGVQTNDSESPATFDYFPSNKIKFTDTPATARPLGQTFTAPSTNKTIEKIALKLSINKDLISNQSYTDSLAGNTVEVKIYGVSSNLPDDGGTLLATSSSVNVRDIIENDETVFTLSYAMTANQNLSFVVNETVIGGGISLLRLERSSIGEEYTSGKGFTKYSGSWSNLTYDSLDYSFYFKIYYNSNAAITETNVGIGNYNDTDINWDSGNYYGCVIDENGNLKLDTRLLISMVVDDTNSMSLCADSSSYVSKFKSLIDTIYTRTQRSVSGTAFTFSAVNMYELNDDVQKLTSGGFSLSSSNILSNIDNLNNVGYSQNLFEALDDTVNSLEKNSVNQIFLNDSTSFDKLLTYLDDENYLNLSTLVTDYNNLSEDDGWDDTKADIPNSLLASNLLLDKFAKSYVPYLFILTDGDDNSLIKLQHLIDASVENWDELGFKYVIFNLGNNTTQNSLHKLAVENDGYYFTISNNTDWDNAIATLAHGGVNSLYRGKWIRKISYNEKKFIKSVFTNYTVSSGQTVDSTCTVKFRYSGDFINYSSWITLSDNVTYSLNKFVTDIEYEIIMTEGWTGSAPVAPNVSELYHTIVEPSVTYLFTDTITTSGYINEYLLTTNIEQLDNIQVDWGICREDSANWNYYHPLVVNRYSVLPQRQKTYRETEIVDNNNLTLTQYGSDLFKFYILKDSAIFNWSNNYEISVFSSGVLLSSDAYRVDNNTGIIVFDSERQDYLSITVNIRELPTVYLSYGETLTTIDYKTYSSINGPWFNDDDVVVLVNNEIVRAGYILNKSKGAVIFKKHLSENDVVSLFVKHPNKFRLGLRVTNYDSNFNDIYKFGLQYTTLNNLNKVEEKNSTSRPYIINNRVQLVSQVVSSYATLSTNYPISLSYEYASDFDTEEAESNLTWFIKKNTDFIEVNTGNSLPNYTNRIIQQSEDLDEANSYFEDTDEIYVSVQLRDDYKFGATYNSEQYELENYSAPYVYDLKIRNNNIFVNDRVSNNVKLVATYTYISNNTPVLDSSVINWYDYSSGEKILLYVGSELPAELVTQGRLLSFEVIPYNGNVYGTTLESNMALVI